jgi:hypothetical protein
METRMAAVQDRIIPTILPIAGKASCLQPMPRSSTDPRQWTSTFGVKRSKWNVSLRASGT